MSEGFQEDLLFGNAGGATAPAQAPVRASAPMQAQAVVPAVAPVPPIVAAPAGDDATAKPVEPPQARPADPVPVDTRPHIAFERRFTEAGRDVFDTVQWEKRSAVIKGEGGRDVFRQEDMDFPASYSQSATNVIASKYFRGTLGSSARERSVRTMISRVVDTLARWSVTSKVTRSPTWVKAAPSKSKPRESGGQCTGFSSQRRRALGSIWRRISQALAIRSTHRRRRVAQVRPW